MKLLYPTPVIAFVVFGLSPMRLVAQTGAAYTKDIDQWHEKRIEDLKAPNGWLNLEGLYWLAEGRSSFGSSPDNKIVFPAGTIAGNAGYFEKSGTTVKIGVADRVDITVDGKPVKEAVIFDKDAQRPSVLASGSLRWSIIQRDEKIGIRLRDLKSPLVTSFKGIDRYPVDTAWRISAVFQPALVPGTIAITNIIGQTNDQRSPPVNSAYRRGTAINRSNVRILR